MIRLIVTFSNFANVPKKDTRLEEIIGEKLWLQILSYIEKLWYDQKLSEHTKYCKFNNSNNSNYDNNNNKCMLEKFWCYQLHWYIHTWNSKNQFNLTLRYLFALFFCPLLSQPHICGNIQGDQKVSVHLMITIHNVTSNVLSVPRQSPDIYWHTALCSRKP